MTTKNNKGNALKQLEAIVGRLTLGRLIKAIREGEEWSLAEMGAKLKVSRGHVAAMERGKPVSPESAARYATLLGYSKDQFVQLALEDELRRVNLNYRVSLQPAFA